MHGGRIASFLEIEMHSQRSFPIQQQRLDISRIKPFVERLQHDSMVTRRGDSERAEVRDADFLFVALLNQNLLGFACNGQSQFARRPFWQHKLYLG